MPPSKQESARLKALVNDLGCAWNMDADQSHFYAKQLTTLANDYPIEVIEAGVAAAIRAEAFRPVPSVLVRYVSEAQPRRSHERCPACQGSEGWRHVSVDGEKLPRAIRCTHDAALPGDKVTVKIGEHEHTHRLADPCFCKTRKDVRTTLNHFSSSDRPLTPAEAKAFFASKQGMELKRKWDAILFGKKMPSAPPVANCAEVAK